MPEAICPHCGYENRLARRWCKRCREPLDDQANTPEPETPAPAIAQDSRITRPAGFETRVRTYSSPVAFNRDAANMARDGWAVASSMERRPPIGCVRIILTGFLALLFPPKPEIVVTYRRER
jgi:hypothetical protein